MRIRMNSSNCYFSDIGDTFGFGKHRNQLLCDVIADDPTYLIWCLNNIYNFGMSELALGQIKLLFPNFPITDTVMQHIGEEYEFQDISNYVNGEIKVIDTKGDEIRSTRPRNYRNRFTYERYGGSYAQDEMGYSDDDIDTIFDGDPSAYWNID